MKNNRVYVDTSVFGGVFDLGFDQSSRKFFEQVKNGQFQLVTSAVVYDEMESAPQEVKNFFDEMTVFAERVAITSEATILRKAYLQEGIVTIKSEDDALHVALATTSGCAMIVSWNFKHIVHYDKIRLYNAVNILRGYDEINIFSPWEVIDYEERI